MQADYRNKTSMACNAPNHCNRSRTCTQTSLSSRLAKFVWPRVLGFVAVQPKNRRNASALHVLWHEQQISETLGRLETNSAHSVTCVKQPAASNEDMSRELSSGCFAKETMSAKVAIASHLCSPKKPSCAENSLASPAVKSTRHRAWPALALSFLACLDVKDFNENRHSGILLGTFDVL